MPMAPLPRFLAAAPARAASRPAAELSLADAVTVPTAVAVFHQFIDDGTPPREWAERLYDIRRWTPMPRGGHFPSAEQPDLLSRDIAAFFNDLSAEASPQ